MVQPQTVRVGLRWLVIACQAATVGITWPLWQDRSSPPPLPLFFSLGVDLGWVMLASLALSLFYPRGGAIAHACVLVTAIGLDQFRLQPQCFGLAILLAATAFQPGARWVRWYFVSVWFWAGTHKLLSPDWLGPKSWALVGRLDLEPVDIHLPIAMAVAVAELGLGVMAIMRPKLVALPCVAMHLGIAAMMTPIALDMNASVIPWNIAMGLVGYWVMRRDATAVPASRFEFVFAATLLLMPAGYYLGWVDRSVASVLYTEVPQGLVTHRRGITLTDSLPSLGVPFPSQPRLHRQYFELTRHPGDKLHIADPRRLLEDQFFVLDASRRAQAVDRDRFFEKRSDEVAGVGLDLPRAAFRLTRSGVKLLKESAGQMIYAAAFSPQSFDPVLLEELEQLPNLRELQLSDTAVTDQNLSDLLSLRLLTGIAVNRTGVTDKGLTQLRELPYLQYVECEQTVVSDELRDWFKQRSRSGDVVQDVNDAERP